MQRWNDLTEIPPGYGPSAVTIGNFDGVHLGHRAVLRRLADTAGARGLRSVAVTFEPHPLAVLYPERAPAPLTTVEHKLELLSQCGLDAVFVMPFTLELATWSPERFVREVFVEALGAKLVVVGGDTRFGHRNSGDVTTLAELGETLGYEVEVLPDVLPDEGDELELLPGTPAPARRWSSTWVRELIAAGDVEGATHVLGHPHRVTGEVVHGDHRGRELGYPTANLAQDAFGAIPADGVYAGWLVRPSTGDQAGERLPAAVSIGTNPTFDGEERRVEAYVLDRTDLHLYGEHVGIEFVARLRPTLRFDGIDPLLVQMADDVARTRAVLAVPSAG